MLPKEVGACHLVSATYYPWHKYQHIKEVYLVSRTFIIVFTALRGSFEFRLETARAVEFLLGARLCGCNNGPK